MWISIFKNSFIGNKLFQKNIKWFAKVNLNRILNHITRDDKILDIWCGRWWLSYLLKKDWYKIKSLDIKNISLNKDISPIIYNWKKIPFENKEFDIALIITVLHHTKKPEEIIKEAIRVANKIIIVEDIYTNSIQKYLTYIMDNIMNFEIFTNPHSNKTDKEWKKVFNNMWLKVMYEKQEKVFRIFRQVTYVLK